MTTLDADFFNHVCRVTCFGGSDLGSCECTSPSTCAARRDPSFAARVEITRGRDRRHLAQVDKRR